jgi:hypothetical protein
MADTKTAGERMADAAAAQALDTKRIADALEALVVIAGHAAKLLEARPAAPASTGGQRANTGAGGPVFPNFGRSKGAPIAGATTQDLEFYANAAVRSLSDPAKERFHTKERENLAAYNAELVRQGKAPIVMAGDFGPPPADPFGPPPRTRSAPRRKTGHPLLAAPHARAHGAPAPGCSRRPPDAARSQPKRGTNAERNERAPDPDVSGPMVRAILEDRKHETRRVVKPQPLDVAGMYADHYRDNTVPASAWGWSFWTADHRMVEPRVIACPYGAPGDRLWVRETWRAWATVGAGDHVRALYAADGAHIDRHMPGVEWTVPKSVAAGKWGPSILMPRWASRLTLEVTGVRVERVQDISEADIAAEGVTLESVRGLWRAATRKQRAEAVGGPLLPDHTRPDDDGAFLVRANYDPIVLWKYAWCLINGRDSWESDPWCWCIAFRRVEQARSAA